MPRRLGSRTSCLFGIIFLSIVSWLSAQQLAPRLILKDGSYQSCTKYEVKGDRVRYLSAERGEWEELPKALVDWPATEKYEKDRAAGASVPEAKDLDQQLEAERVEESLRSPEILPGLRLPEDGGVFMLDTFHDKAQLVPVEQNNSGHVNADRKGNILRATVNPVAGNRQIIEIKGSHAEVQSHVQTPTLYISLAPQTPDQAALPFDRFKIVRLERKGDQRIVGDIKTAVYGKVSQEGNFIPTTIERMKGDWVKLSPTDKLENGEYAVVEMLGKEGMNLMVWDFGVNPNAGPNAAAWGADLNAAAPSPPEKPKELKGRDSQ